jgi:hypothetical protein
LGEFLSALQALASLEHPNEIAEAMLRRVDELLIDA